MNQTMTNINKKFQEQTVEEMSARFQAILQDLLYLSSQEERLQSDVKSSSRNSPDFVNLHLSSNYYKINYNL